MNQRKKVGLALGSGGAKGLAHIGVLKVLEEYNIPIDFISGSSMGAVIAALYSLEPNAKKLEKEALSMKWKNVFDYTISKYGLIRGNKIEKILREKFSLVTFDDMKIPLYVTAYDIQGNQEIIFHKGDVAKAVRASIAVPGFFFPVENKGKILVDGGVIDPVPVGILKSLGAEVVIAVNVCEVHQKKPLTAEEAVPGFEVKKSPHLLYTVFRALQTMESEACRAEISRHKIDFLISPNLEDFSTSDFIKVDKIIAIGETSARKALYSFKQIEKESYLREILEELNKKANV